MQSFPVCFTDRGKARLKYFASDPANRKNFREKKLILRNLPKAHKTRKYQEHEQKSQEHKQSKTNAQRLHQ
jgi:hypothetical protein